MLHTHSFTYHARCIMFLSQYFSFPVSIIPPMLHTHLHPYATHIRTCGWRLGTFKWAMLVQILGSAGQKRTLALFGWCAFDIVSVEDARLLGCDHLHTVMCKKTCILLQFLQESQMLHYFSSVFKQPHGEAPGIRTSLCYKSCIKSGSRPFSWCPRTF